MVEIYKETEGQYVAFNDKNGKSAYIIRIYEYNPLGRDLIRYRVDYQGRTKLSMATLTEAKSFARKLLKS